MLIPHTRQSVVICVKCCAWVGGWLHIGLYLPQGQLYLECVHKTVHTGLGNETGKFQNIKKKSTHGFFIYLLVINEKRMNSHFVLCQFENLCFESNALKMASFRRTHSSSRDLQLFMTSRSISTGIAATSSWIPCSKSMTVLGLVSNTFVFRYPQRK